MKLMDCEKLGPSQRFFLPSGSKFGMIIQLKEKTGDMEGPIKKQERI